jgi:alkanesulfonate monooxygenase SsuD/methylene tetrahydromethanopterin reductase-like flavin-dependent oxidoreductase (luciferase family)
MKAWFFSEMPYPYLPDEREYESIRVSLPSSTYDPKLGAALYNRYIDDWVAADALGLEIMTNEHHQTATCLDVAAPLTMAILARETKRARLLILGNPIANRRDPVRVAEEMAMVDNLSYGRLECGFVRGVPYEVAPANVSPVRQAERLWEAHDLIRKAWTTHDGPFNWEGKHFRYRQVNVWPRPYQQPHPPIWITGGSPASARRIADHGYVVATFLSSFGAKDLFDAYRDRLAERARECGVEAPPVSLDRFAYAALVYVGETDEAGYAGARQVQWYLQTNKAAPQFANPPGYATVAANVQAMRRAAGGAVAQTGFNPRTASLEELIDRGIVFAGNPDTVFDQIKRFYDRIGGFGHLLMMAQGGWLSHEATVAGLKRFAAEVYPRLQELTSPIEAGAAR